MNSGHFLMRAHCAARGCRARWRHLYDDYRTGVFNLFSSAYPFSIDGRRCVGLPPPRTKHNFSEKYLFKHIGIQTSMASTSPNKFSVRVAPASHRQCTLTHRTVTGRRVMKDFFFQKVEGSPRTP